jgi:hypothetical protein
MDYAIHGIVGSVHDETLIIRSLCHYEELNVYRINDRGCFG